VTCMHLESVTCDSCRHLRPQRDYVRPLINFPPSQTYPLPEGWKLSYDMEKLKRMANKTIYVIIWNEHDNSAFGVFAAYDDEEKANGWVKRLQDVSTRAFKVYPIQLDN
jgi:hypothetical protein